MAWEIEFTIKENIKIFYFINPRKSNTIDKLIVDRWLLRSTASYCKAIFYHHHTIHPSFSEAKLSLLVQKLVRTTLNYQNINPSECVPI